MNGWRIRGAALLGLVALLGAGAGACGPAVERPAPAVEAGEQDNLRTAVLHVEGMT